MDCWVSKQGKKGAWSSFLKDFLEIFINKYFGFDIFEKGPYVTEKKRGPERIKPAIKADPDRYVNKKNQIRPKKDITGPDLTLHYQIFLSLSSSQYVSITII